MLSAEDAADLYLLLGRYGVRCWIVGGWGVDALLHRQTRAHKDLDVLIARADLVKVDRLFADRGFVRTLVWPEENRWIEVDGDRWPTAFVVADEQGRELDIHVVDIGPSGDVTALWDLPWRFGARFLDAHGRIGQTTVACASVEAQLQMHTGYPLPAAHARDVELLTTRAPDRED